MTHTMTKYYIIEASYGPMIEEAGLRYGELDAENPEYAIHKARTEFNSFGHVRVEVFANEADYRARKSPLAMWENRETLARIVQYEHVRQKFEAFFVNPIFEARPLTLDFSDLVRTLH